MLAAPVAQTCSLSVSPGIVAGRANSPERGCVRSTSRSASKPLGVAVLPQSFGSLLAAAAGPADTAALLWLRLCRAELYRRFLACQLPLASNILPITNRRLARSLPLARSSGPLPRFAGQSPFAASQAAQVSRLTICATLNNRYRIAVRPGAHGASVAADQEIGAPAVPISRRGGFNPLTGAEK